MALWVFVYMGTTPIGSIVTGAITSAGGAREPAGRRRGVPGRGGDRFSRAHPAESGRCPVGSGWFLTSGKAATSTRRSRRALWRVAHPPIEP
jgi:hypothetical protein